MIRGLYTSAWSMQANSKKMDVISNNLANVNTNAYKRDTVVFETFPSMLTKRINDAQGGTNPTGDIGNMQPGSDVTEVYTCYNKGSILKTSNNFDLALKDDNSDPEVQGKNAAFFTVWVPDEEGNLKEYYTKDGSFVVNADKQLTTKDGYLVVGENGPISLEGENFSVQADGTIVQNGIVLDKLLIKDFTDTTTLRKTGANLMQTTEQTEEKEFKGQVMQGFLEQSNVNVVREMVDMISVMRAYEANQKLIQTQDGTLEKAVNEVGAVR